MLTKRWEGTGRCMFLGRYRVYVFPPLVHIMHVDIMKISLTSLLTVQLKLQK